ncbi:MAG TPA: PIN domain-containing protein [Thermoanaerobaculia bacterium]|nr:PIN domain-containing protein [Thermoanaerobaculia bacterium]
MCGELAQFLASPRARVLGLDEETADRYAVILNSLWSAGTPIPTNDVWIAASAMQHGFRVVTADQHFQCREGSTVYILYCSEDSQRLAPSFASTARSEER